MHSQLIVYPCATGCLIPGMPGMNMFIIGIHIIIIM